MHSKSAATNAGTSASSFSPIWSWLLVCPHPSASDAISHWNLRCVSPSALPHHGIADLLAFSIIFAIARRPGIYRYPGASTILDTIVQDATVYFIFMFVCQLLLEFFLLFAPVSDPIVVICILLTTHYVQEEIQLMPGV